MSRTYRDFFYLRVHFIDSPYNSPSLTAAPVAEKEESSPLHVLRGGNRSIILKAESLFAGTILRQESYPGILASWHPGIERGIIVAFGKKRGQKNGRVGGNCGGVDLTLYLLVPMSYNSFLLQCGIF